MTLFGQTLRSTAYDLADAFKVNDRYIAEYAFPG